ncbi:sigma 54-interacting transcriptional regulator [Congregibacter litoralis]|uniref:Sigma-54 interaction domain protein n=1 Tax=Congregibacter litoralis KT71 TaxID=314285 RepID=A4A5I6_9GAMM|nr:sigma 54-interacting transcriptional regulator [Congregibacter litoralis]EAQ99057.2 Sigma-54 interaction domain protein [Congregibacter litoralis KT71]
MSNSEDGGSTRSIDSSDTGFTHTGGHRQAPLELYAVLAFHPDTSRIGAIFRASPHEKVISFGRHSPTFQPSRPGEPPDACNGSLESADALVAVNVAESTVGSTHESTGEGLGERVVSRKAFSLMRDGECWRLLRHEGSSRLRINGQELRDEATLSEDQLMSGVVLTLAQRIVLHLRLRGHVAPSDGMGELVALRGVSAAMAALRESALAAAKSRDDVLLIGPTGSGKERIARAIHALACSSGEPWVAVNMAALPTEIASAALFGARKGAYTGADSHRRGFFQEADGGTLFLDEVGDTPPALQPMLLRALQEREIQVVGGNPQRVDLRVIAAMEQDPDHLRDSFRPALRYRLGALEIRLPALAERAEDVALLAADFFRARAREADDTWDVYRGNAGPGAWARLFEEFLLYPWPGNIRECQHIVAQISNVSHDGLQVPATIRARWRRSSGDARPSEAQSQSRKSQINEPSPKRLADVSDEVFAEAWKKARYEVATIARDLGVSRPAIYRRLKTLRDCRLAADVPLGELLSALDACRGDLRSTAERLAVSRQGLQTRLRASGVAPANFTEIFEDQDSP